MVKGSLAERNSRILETIKSGKTLEFTGALYGLNRERIRQIVKSFGFTSTEFRPPKPEPVYTPKQQIAKLKRQADRVAKSMGCDKKPSVAFLQQRQNAERRGVAFNLTFEQWWGIWEPYYGLRGRNKGGLVMCRHLDRGDYSVGNVRIDGASENVRESRLGNRSRKMKIVHTREHF